MLRFIVDVLATYRITKLVIEDELLGDLRDAIYDRVPHDSKVAYLLGCPWCVSFWAGVGVFALRRYAPEALSDIVSSSLAASAVTGLMYERL